ncbi:hypothetical protein B9P52_04575 [Achromobacter denitrificans]|uniref:hypothetical protein n=1 Tax=Achromobacter denitrificans TaxID=32002 RepID=UPI000B4C79F7|nr:hypothetical protein [Achromobacter denitrificans]ASC63611.1 hypothetical protein B9P52_04575 [Achromobacter denitrificans]
MEDEFDNLPPEGEASQGTDNGAPAPNEPDTAGDLPPASAGSQAAAFLDSLTEGGAADAAGGAPAGRARDDLGRFKAGTPVQDHTGAAPQQPVDEGAQPPATAAPAPKSPEQEDVELLAGIKSDRGRARVAQIIEDRKAAQGEVAAVRELVQAAGMTAETFGQHIEFSRLANSSDPRDLQQAVQMIEQTRADLYRRLGQDAPGVDALSDFPDLAQMVQNMQMPRETALEVAKMRREHQAIHEQRQQQHVAQQQSAQFEQDVALAQRSLESYIQTRAHEIDHPARMQALQAQFSDPRKMQEFVATYAPRQWPHVLRMLYDNAQVAPPARRAPPAPISGRTGALGRPAPSADQPAEQRIMSHIDRLDL